MEEKSFEENLERLKELVKQLQSGELTLDESLKVFEEGIYNFKKDTLMYNVSLTLLEWFNKRFRKRAKKSKNRLCNF